MFSDNLKKNVRYGMKPRNYLDIYIPNEVLSGKKCPVVVFVNGGAWIIGYKAWGALVGKILIRFGILVVMPDYRNYPQGTIEDMIEDIDVAVGWVLKHIHRYGGDPDQVYLAGQSAGAHLVFCSAMEHASTSTEPPLPRHEHYRPWCSSALKSIVLLSGPWDLVGMMDHFHSRGLHRSIFSKIFDCDLDKLLLYSPIEIVRNPAFTKQVDVSKLPQIWLLHGTADSTVPSALTIEFARHLSEAGARVLSTFYRGKSHTDPILEDLMEETPSADGDIVCDLADYVLSGGTAVKSRVHAHRKPCSAALEHDPLNVADEREQLAHPVLVAAARYANPF